MQSSAGLGVVHTKPAWKRKQISMLAWVAILLWTINAKTVTVLATKAFGDGADDTDDTDGPLPSQGHYWFNVHGGLIVVAWVLLLPMGKMLAEHTWLVGDTLTWGKPRWFWLRAFCQLSGMALLIAGFVIAHKEFKGTKTGLAKTHGDLGIAVLALSIVGVVAANIRAHPERERRFIVRFILEILGPVNVLLAWSNIYVGIVVYHNDWGEPYAPWIAPVATAMGLLMLLEVFLWRKGRSKQQDAREPGVDAKGAGSDSFIDMEAVGSSREPRGRGPQAA